MPARPESAAPRVRLKSTVSGIVACRMRTRNKRNISFAADLLKKRIPDMRAASSVEIFCSLASAATSAAHSSNGMPFFRHNASAKGRVAFGFFAAEPVVHMSRRQRKRRIEFFECQQQCHAVSTTRKSHQNAVIRLKKRVCRVGFGDFTPQKLLNLHGLYPWS